MPQLPPRAADSHKGDYGRVLLIGGSRGMAGSISLAGLAALRSGAGLVTLAVPRSIQPTVASFEPSYMTYALGCEEADTLDAQCSKLLLELADQSTVVALGPGLGSAAETARLVHLLYHRVKQPMIVDADGLNALASHTELLESPAGPRVLTPHPGEFQRLTGAPHQVDVAQRAEQTAQLCHRDASCQTIVVLKGHASIVCDGEQYVVNSTGNPGMATGGTGDSLTGIIATLVGQGLDPWTAARLGTHVHGLAGDAAAEALGQVSMIASDLIDYLPATFRSCT